MAYYSTLKRKETLSHAIAWMHLEDIMLSEISQSQQDKYCMMLLYKTPRLLKFIEEESRRVAAEGKGREK